MKGRFYLTMCFFIYAHLCFGKYSFQVDTPIIKPRVLYIMKFHNKPSVTTFNNFLDPSTRKSIQFLRGAEYEKVYKDLKISVIAIVHLKPDIQTLTLTDVLTNYHIPIKYRNAKVKYNDEVIDWPETMLMSSSLIAKVNLVKTANGYFINIIGIDYLKVKKLKDYKGERTGGE